MRHKSWLQAPGLPHSNSPMLHLWHVYNITYTAIRRLTPKKLLILWEPNNKPTILGRFKNSPLKNGDDLGMVKKFKLLPLPKLTKNSHKNVFPQKKTLPCIPCQPAQATPVANNRPSHVHSWDTRPRCPTRETLVVAELAPGELP